MIEQVLLYTAGGFLLLASLIPFIRNDYWVFRIFEYPRLQKWILTLVVLLLFIILMKLDYWYEWAFVAALFANLTFLSVQIYPFLPIARHQMLPADPQKSEASFSLMISNVYQYNENKDGLLNLIRHRKPNLVILSETDQAWEQALQQLYENYPYRVVHPLDNTYGIIFLSQLEITESEVRFLVEDDVPSIFALVRLPSGSLFQMICLHPTPPVPSENTRSTERDKEILIVGRLAKKSPLPVVVSGDLNDVAWSYTNELFQETSGLLDPRRGRGFFNTFHAQHRFFRYPLDHIFCSQDFRLQDIERLPDIGSDHFPIWASLVYEPSDANEQEIPTADRGEEELADKKINAKTD
jgi:endonuclease/exonuclease/phosphatase (EEP) superfamily protein YafD